MRFDDRDLAGAPLVGVVSAEFARRYFGDADPVGRRIGGRPASGPASLDFEIVGVVGDAKYQDGRRTPYPMYFLPFLQQTGAARTANLRNGVALDRSHSSPLTLFPKPQSGAGYCSVPG